MEFLFILMLLGFGGLVIASPIMAIVALVKIGDLRADLAYTNRLLRDLQGREPGAAAPPPEGRPATPAAAPPVPEPAAPPERTVAEPPPPAPPVPSPPTPPAAASPGLKKEGLEEKFVSRWLVPLAAIAGFLGIAYLYDYSVEMGWLGPAGQCIIGAGLGLIFITAGEVLRRHPWERAAAVIKPSLIPAALVAVGVSCLYFSIYAAYALFHLLVPEVAFVLMFIVWGLAIGLSILYGPLVAALGILGGFLVPILVHTGNPSAYKLFPYLLAVSAAALGVLRYKGWGWLAWCTLAGAAAWPVLWMVDQPALDLGAPAVGFYLIAVAALFIYVPAGLAPHMAPITLSNLFNRLPRPAILAWSASAATLLLSLLLVWVDDFQTGSVVSAGLLGAFLMIAGRRDVTFDLLAVGAATLVAVVLVTWDLPYWPGDIDVLATLPPGLVPFVMAASGYAALFGVVGFGMLRGAARPGLWAAVSAGVPLVTLAVVFARIRGFEVDLAWAGMGLALAALNLGATMWVSRQRGVAGMEGAVAAYAVGVVASVTLAMTMALENAWLTVALALQLPALGWIHEKTKVQALRIVALLLSGGILIRLVFNYEVFEYGLGSTPGLNWMLYGYGIPTIAFYAASRLFRRSADDRLVLALEAGALAFLTLFCTLEIADIIEGGRFLPGDSLLEASLRTIAWLTIAVALLWQCRAEKPRVVAVWGWQILALLAAGHVAMGHLLGLNPLFTGDPVGSWWFANVLLLAYAVPAVFAVAIRIESERQGHPSAPAIGGISGLALAFVWITLVVRHAFHGSYLNAGPTTDAEWWAYSVFWLLYAVLLLAAGVWRQSTRMRYASLVVVILAVGKAVFDISEMRGLWLVASLFGLMIFILGIAWVYRRYVFPPSAPESAVTA